MEITVYQNNRNENKFIEVKKTKCSHFYIRQYIKQHTKMFNAKQGKKLTVNVLNYMGNKKGYFSRVTRKNILNDLLQDYTEKGSYITK